MELVHNNYMRGTGHGADWHVDIDPPTRKVKSYFEESCIAAEMIYSQKVGKLYLCYSGGLDSEYVLAIFRKLGMEIHPVIMRNQYNAHETRYAFKYCDDRNIDYTVIDLDFDDFVESGKLLEIANSVKCAAFELPASMWLASQLDGTIITGGADPHMKLNQSDNLWYLDEEEIIHTHFTYWEQNKLNGTPYFLSYTSEQFLSFLLDPTMVKLANHSFPGKLGTHSSKVLVYNNKTDFNLEQRVKQTGYEIVKQSPIFNHPDIQTVRGYSDKWLGTSDHQYHELIKRLGIHE